MEDRLQPVNASARGILSAYASGLSEAAVAWALATPAGFFGIFSA